MHIEYIKTRKLESETLGALEQYLLQLEGDVHRPVATEVLCAASMWAYSDLTTFATWMCHRGLYGEFVGINVANDVAFVDTTAYLYLSDSKKLAILAFRGTELTNPVNWLADVSAKMAVGEEGGIHSGFLTAALVLMPMLREILHEWTVNKRSLAEAVSFLREWSAYPAQAFPTYAELRPQPTEPVSGGPKGLEKEPLTKADMDELADRVADNVLEAIAESQEELKPGLYICGHSFGGAVAAMAGAQLYVEPSLLKVKRTLRSIYTFGAPMWASTTYVNTLEEKGLGKRLFRHRYENDVVPLLPARSQGEYKHLGQSYKSSNGVWVRSSAIEEQASMALLAVFWGLMPFLTDNAAAWQLFGVRWFDKPWLLKRILPYSWTDHVPLRYLSVSQAGRSGFEILGGELTGRVPMAAPPPKPDSPEEPQE